MVRLIVLGGLGYVGSVLTRFLKGAFPDREICVVDPGWFASTSVGPEPTMGAFTLLTDIRDIPNTFFRPSDVVVNLAAVSNDAMGHRFDVATGQINSSEAVRMARMAREGGASLYIYASSASVYGHSGSALSSEEDDTNPQTEYARSKLLAEHSLERLSSDSFSVVCLRFATAFGMSPNMRTDLAISDFVATALVEDRVVLKSSGQSRRSFIPVGDMARSISWVIESGQKEPLGFEVFNVGHMGMNFRVVEVAEMVANALEVPLHRDSHAAADTRDYMLQYAKWCRFAPGWAPSRSFEEVIVEMRVGLAELIGQGTDVRGGNFVRLEALRSLVARGVLNENNLELSKT